VVRAIAFDKRAFLTCLLLVKITILSVILGSNAQKWLFLDQVNMNEMDDFANTDQNFEKYSHCSTSNCG